MLNNLLSNNYDRTRSDIISSLTLEDVTKIVNAFTDINIPIEAVREEILLTSTKR